LADIQFLRVFSSLLCRTAKWNRKDTGKIEVGIEPDGDSVDVAN
jgi:hypothetical protein